MYSSDSANVASMCLNICLAYMHGIWVDIREITTSNAIAGEVSDVDT